MRRKPLKSIALLFCSGLLIMVLLEVTLRLLGYEPFKPKSPVAQVGIKAWEPDSILGWKLIPGSYDIGPFNDIGGSMSITIKEDTGRITRMNNKGVTGEQITFIGGSFIMGHGLDDGQTAARKLQERFPSIDFRNLAVSGYGAFQSLLVLENELKKGNLPKCVIYGAIEHHQFRNVAQGDWLMELQRKMPFVTLINDSTFQRNEVVGMYNVPFTKKLALAFMTQKAINRLLSYERVKDARNLSYLIIKEMHLLTSEYQIAFYVAPLKYEKQGMEELSNFLTDSGINFIDCNVPLTKDNTIEDDVHPDESVNDIWADRVANQLTADHILN